VKLLLPVPPAPTKSRTQSMSNFEQPPIDYWSTRTSIMMIQADNRTTRPTRGIAIQRPNKHDAESQEADLTYDWATWRLYHRILDHRQKHPTSHESSSPIDFSHPSSSKFTSIRPGRTGHNDDSMVPSKDEEDALQDGEVFELDM
jgi:hypothetical protein